MEKTFKKKKCKLNWRFMKKIIGCKKEIIIYFFALLITGLFFGTNIIQYQGKKAALIILLYYCPVKNRINSRVFRLGLLKPYHST